MQITSKKFYMTKFTHHQPETNFAESFLESFKASAYPYSHVVFSDQFGLIEVRIPPRLLSGLTSPHQFPAIEVIELQPEIQGKGVLKRVIGGILEQPGVVGVCVSHISNLRLRDVLGRWGWFKLATRFPELPTFYTVKDAAYRRALIKAGLHAFDERLVSDEQIRDKLGFNVFRDMASSLERSLEFPS